MVSELRELRRQLALSQAEFADRLGVPAETLRTWDSGRRPAPAPVMRRARDAACRCVDETELVRLKQLATEFSVHPATLQAAAKTGKLVVHFSEKSAFGRPILYATRGEVKRFKAVHYRRSGEQRTLLKPLATVPPDYDQRLKCVRQRLRLSQDDLARLIGAAGKAVVYQWEVRKRCPSPVFWQGIEKVERTH